TGDLYREPGFTPRNVREKYDYFMSRAKENLKANPLFYVNNVLTSFGACFSGTCWLMTPHLRWFVLLFGLGFYCRLALASRFSLAQAFTVAALLLLALLGFVATFSRWPVWMGAASFALLPFFARGGMGWLHSLGSLFAVLGIALFGMRE